MTENKRLFVGRKKVEDKFTIILDYDDEIGVKENQSGDVIVLKHNDLNAQQFVAQLVVFLNDQNQAIVDLYDGCEYWSDKASERITLLEKENCQLKREKERYKQLSEIRAENINNRILSLREFINDCEDEKVKNALEDLFYSEVKEYDLAKENRELKAEKELWKGEACNCSNYLSILSMDCQIVQEAICDLKNVIDVDTEAFKLLDELDDKFDELNLHRIKMYSR